MSTRATRDVGLYRRAELAEAETALREAVAVDLGDWFTFEASGSRQMTAGVIGLTIALTARIGNREWARFNVDLVGEAAGMTGEPETAPALARIDLVELDQPGFRVWPLADHVADKLAATFATYGRTNRASTRVKDLIDLVVAAGKTRMEAMRCLKRRISDAVYRQLLADARADANRQVGTGPGGHFGASQESSAVDLPPHIDTSDQPLPGPATTTLPGTKPHANPCAASAPRPSRRRAGAVKVERPTGRTTLTATSAGAHSAAPKPPS